MCTWIKFLILVDRCELQKYLSKTIHSVASAMHICMLIGGEHFYIAQYYHTTVKICFILEDID